MKITEGNPVNRPLDIVLKYPTRGRPETFLATLQGWVSKIHDLSRVSILISYDADDLSMSASVLDTAQRLHSNVTLVRGLSKSKIAACNADLSTYAAPWDVVLLVSDDMICIQPGWDSIIRQQFFLHHPDTDGALWFNDGRQHDYNTIECVGRKRYERFGYLYHPSYVSFFCDLESTDVGKSDEKLVYIETPICRHDHPYWSNTPYDDTYTKNLGFGPQDECNYHERKGAGFP